MDDEDDDAVLARAAAAGSDQAFGRLVDRHQASVRAFLRRLCRSAADADDLAQETFLTAWSRIGTAEAAKGLRPWLCGIAYRKWLTKGRADARRRLREAEADWSERPADPDTRLSAAAALGVLPPEQRAAVALCLAGGFSHAEAAIALALPLGTIKSHVTRGRARLLEFLESGA